MSDVKQISELFENNYNTLTQEFPSFAKSKQAYVAAAHFTSKELAIDPERLGNTCFLLKDLCAPFPALNGNGLLISASLLSTQERDIESRLADLSEICRKLNGQRESAGITPSAVFLVEENANPLEWSSIYSAIRTIKHLASTSFPELPAPDPTPCTALVLSGSDPEDLFTEIGELRNELRKNYGEKEDHTYSACMLSLCNGSVEEKTKALINYTTDLSKEIKLSAPFFLPVYISLLCSSKTEDSAAQIANLTLEMKKKKGFGIFSLSASKRLALCALASQKHSTYTQELLALDHLCKNL